MFTRYSSVFEEGYMKIRLELSEWIIQISLGSKKKGRNLKIQDVVF